MAIGVERTEYDLTAYFRRMGATKPLSREKEAELTARIRAGDMEARDELVKANLRFVATIALKYQQWLPLPELISAGNLGLVIAAERFDATRGHKFITYAVWWIRQSMMQAIAEQSRLISLPFSQISLLREMVRIFRRLGQENGSADGMGAFVGELAEELRVPVQQVMDILHSNYSVASLDKELLDDKGKRLQDFLPDTRQEPPDAEAVRNSDRALLDSVLTKLKERERYILRLYFGLETNVPLTLQEIGDLIGVSRERVRQIKETALSKLRYASHAKILKTLQEEM